MGNPVTTGRIGRTVYDLRHWKLTLLVLVVFMPLVLIWRVLAGRDLIGGKRTTDATFLRPARHQRKNWWADKAGWQRAGLRLAALGMIWAYLELPVLFWILAVGEAAVTTCVAVRRFRERKHVRTVLMPLWPALAGIIGVPEDQPPQRWLYIPDVVGIGETRNSDGSLSFEGDSIVVGLRAADDQDHKRVAALVALFDQRYHRAHYGRVDHQRRRVSIRVRPQEHRCWPAVANALGVSAAALEQDWMEISGSPETPGSTVRVYLPADVVNQSGMRTDLHTAIDDAFSGTWGSRIVKAKDATTETPGYGAHVIFTHQQPKATPPEFVDFLAEHPEYRPADQQEGVNN